jgi:hypothetical protein
VRYTPDMELLVVLGVAALVALDTLLRQRRRRLPADEGAISTQKIVIDLSKR